MIARLAMSVLITLSLVSCSSAQQAPNKPYHHLSNGGFRNPQGNDLGRPKLWDLTKMVFRRIGDTFRTIDVPKYHTLSEPEAIAQYNKLQQQDTITWLGHKAFLIKIDGKVILTDPYLTNIAGPFGLIGPRRFTAPGVQINQLPHIDMILISHNHYDSLDVNTIKQLRDQANITVITPLKNGHYFTQYQYQDVRELDWYQSTRKEQFTITALPAIHFSGRGPFDRDKELWAGFIIQTAHHKIFFASDSAWGKIYQQLGQQYGPFDLVMVDIAAYEPPEIMRFSHTTPEEGVRLAKDMQAKTMLAMHWGTVKLSDEPPFEPPGRFIKAARKAGYDKQHAWVMRVGETRVLPR